MIIKVFLIAVILLAISMLGIGLKIFFDMSSGEEAGNCENENSDQKIGCGCGAGFCEVTKKEQT